jgi:hypothetical protein
VPFSFALVARGVAASSLDILRSVNHFYEPMKTASVRDLRQNFPTVMRWIVRCMIVVRLIPERVAITRNAPAPDFDLISQRIFGAKKFRGNLADMERQGYDF